jgi:predicted transcriptional regulator of viral defense system
MRSRDLVTAGLSRVAISRMVASGELVRIARGLYALPDAPRGEHEALAIVAYRVPAAIFCLLTALRIHGLTTQAPFEVWIAIGNKARPPRMDYPRVRVVRQSPQALNSGTETRKFDGAEARVTTVEKTVADCFKFRGLVGLDVALEALRDARRSRKLNLDELWRQAKVNRVANVIRPYLEAIV